MVFGRWLKVRANNARVVGLVVLKIEKYEESRNDGTCRLVVPRSDTNSSYKCTNRYTCSFNFTSTGILMYP